MKYIRRPGITDIPLEVDAIQLQFPCVINKYLKGISGLKGDFIVTYPGDGREQTIEKMVDFLKQYRKAE